MFRLVLCIYFIINFHYDVFSQSVDFNYTYHLDGRSTSFQQIELVGPDFLILGQTGIDTTGVSGLILLKMDTFGVVKETNYYYDPFYNNHLIVDGTQNMLLDSNKNSTIIAGVLIPDDDLFFTEIDSIGNIVFFKVYDLPFKTLYVHCIISLKNEYYCIGFVQTQNFDHDVFVFKLNSQGEKIWYKTYGVMDLEEGARFAIIEADGITILISQAYDPTPTILNDIERRTKLMHIDTSGSIKWEKSSELNQEGPTSGGFTKSDDDYLYSTWNINEIDQISSDLGMSITKRDSEFKILWKKDYSPISGINTIKRITYKNECALFAWGQTFDEILWANILKINTNDGNLLWNLRDTGIYSSEHISKNIINDLVELNNGDLFAIGSTYNFKINQNEGLIIKIIQNENDSLCTITNSLNINSKENNVKAFPNPCRDYVIYNIPEGTSRDNYQLLIYDLFGRLLLHVQLEEGNNKIPITEKLKINKNILFWEILTSDKVIVESGKLLIYNNL